MPSSLFQSLLLAATVFSGSNAAPAPPAYCPKPNPVVNSLKGSASATSFCEWYLPVVTTTLTAYKTIGSETATVVSTKYKGTNIVTLPATTKTKTAAAVTVTSLSTTIVTTNVIGDTTTQISTSTSVETSIATTSVTKCVNNRLIRRAAATPTVPAALKKVPASDLKAACSCLSIPAKTTTITSTASAKCSKTVTSVTTIPYRMTVQPTVTSFVTPTVSVTGTSTDIITQTETSTISTATTSVTTSVTTSTTTITVGPPEATNEVVNGDFQSSSLAPWRAPQGPAALGGTGNQFAIIGPWGSRPGPPTILTQHLSTLRAGERYNLKFTSALSAVYAGTTGDCTMSVLVGSTTVAFYRVDATDVVGEKSVKTGFFFATANPQDQSLDFRFNCNALNNSGGLEVNIDDVEIISAVAPTCPVED